MNYCWISFWTSCDFVAAKRSERRSRREADATTTHRSRHLQEVRAPPAQEQTQEARASRHAPAATGRPRLVDSARQPRRAAAEELAVGARWFQAARTTQQTTADEDQRRQSSWHRHESIFSRTFLPHLHKHLHSIHSPLTFKVFMFSASTQTQDWLVDGRDATSRAVHL